MASTTEHEMSKNNTKRRPRRKQRGRKGRDDVTKVVLDLPVAQEVIELIEDRPGEADEDALDEALAALEEAEARVPAADQERAARGDVVAIEMTLDAVDAVSKLIVDDQETKPRVLKRVARRLRGKLQSARHKSEG